MLDLILQAGKLVDDLLPLLGGGWVLALGGGPVNVVDGLGLVLGTRTVSLREGGSRPGVKGRKKDRGRWDRR